jgi:long-chain acyl-CoA synthetase
MGGGLLKTYTWAQALDETRRIAAYLKSLGLAHGDRVALISKNTAWWLMADWAIWMAGGVSVPLYPTLAAKTVREILTHSGAKLLFIGKLDAWDSMQAGVPDGLPCVRMPLAPMGPAPAWEEIVAHTPPMAESPVREADEMATIMYTSGTTGQSKGVMLSFGALAWAVDSGNQRTPLSMESRMLSYLPLSHVAERTGVECTLLDSGMQVFFAESLDTFAADLVRARPSTFFSVPRLWLKFQQGVSVKMPPARLKRLLKFPVLGGLVRKKVLGALGLDACTYAAGGGSPMPEHLLNWYTDLGLPLCEVYGMTENCGVSHATLKGVTRPGTVGLPHAGVQHRVDPLTSEVQMRSGALMMGYYRDPERTRDAFTSDGWLRTGDKGTIDAEGYLTITGRIKDLFKTSKGKYVAPAPIEVLVGRHAAIEACCVAGSNLRQPLCLVMLNADAARMAKTAEGRAALEAELGAHKREVDAMLDPHERLDFLVVVTETWTVDNEFVTPTFKVKRDRIEAAYASRYEHWAAGGRAVVWADR